MKTALATVVAVWALLAGPAVCARTKLNPITRIAGLLQDMIKKCEADQDKEDKMLTEFRCWAKGNIDQYQASISEAQLKIKDLESFIDDIQNGRVEFTSERGDLEKEITNLRASIEQAESNRESAKADYDAAKEEMGQAIVALGDAIQVMEAATASKASALIKIGEGSAAGFEAHTQQAASLARAADLADKHMDAADAMFLRRLLTGQVQPDHKKLNRKSTFKMSYKARSGGIQKILKDLLEQTKEDEKTADAKEERDLADYTQMKASLDKQLESATDAAESGSVEAAAAEENKELANKELDHNKKELADSTKFVAQIEQTKKEQEGFFRRRRDARLKEMTGLNKAIGILRSDDARDLFARSQKSQGYLFLQKFGSKLQTVHDHHREEPKSVSMNAVGRSIDNVIADVKAEKDKLVADRESCKQNITDHKAFIHTQNIKINDLEKLKDDLNTEIKHNEGEQLQLNKEINATRDDIAQATSDRDSQHQEYLDSRRDDEAAVEILGQAIKVLEETYEALLQVKGTGATTHKAEPPAPPPVDFADHYVPEEPSVTKMLEIARDEVSEDIKTSKEQDDKAQVDFEEAKANMETHISELQAGIDDLEDQRQTLLGHRDDRQADINSETGTRDDEQRVLDSIMPGCTYILDNFDKIAAALDTEVANLETAKGELLHVKKKNLR